MNTAIKLRQKQQLIERKAQQLYRKRQVFAKDNEAIKNFASNDYLGLSTHNDVIKACQLATEKYGVGSGASPMLNGYSPLHQKAEQAFAQFLNRDKALLFSSGYLANLGALTALTQKSTELFLDKAAHSSLIDATLLSRAKFHRYPHLDYDMLEKKLQKSNAFEKIIVTESVFSMSGHPTDLIKIADLAKKHDALLLLDDAHGIGIIGEGKGATKTLSQKELPILTCPLGKALGCQGGIVAGNNQIIETILQFAKTYTYSTALPPAICAALLASLNLLEKETWRREKLLALSHYFYHQAGKYALNLIGTPETPICPIEIGCPQKTIAVQKKLKEQGMIVSAIRPPSVPNNGSLLRISLHCDLNENDINQLLLALSVTLNDH